MCVRFQFGEMDGNGDGDGWFQGRNILSHRQLSRGFLAMVLLFIAIWMNMMTMSYGQQQSGFLSIYCGYPSDFTDGNNGLDYVTDVNSSYINTGLSSTQLPNYDQAKNDYFRYFPETRNKYCYELPTNPDTTYLFRASFADPSKTNLTLPIEFIVSINATVVYTLKYPVLQTKVSSGYGFVFGKDVIFDSHGRVTYVCLQPVVGTAFISTVELRPLEASMYNYAEKDRQYLVNLQRLNTGSNASAEIRFPNDPYDRIWHNTYDIGLPIVSNSTPVDESLNPNANNVPPIVMEDAWAGEQISVFFLDLFFTTPVYVDPGQYIVYAAVYSEELNPNSGGGVMAVAFDGMPGGNLNVSNEANFAFTANFLLSANNIEISLTSPDSSDASFISMNAVEIYSQYNFNQSATTSNDDAAITAVKNSFKLTDWGGDPCTPVPHDWLSCSTASADTSITTRGQCVSKSTPGCNSQTGQFLRADYFVTSLTLTSLPTSGFPLLIEAVSSGDIVLESLTNLSITGSGVDAATFQFLLRNFTGTKLNSLDFSNNDIDSVPDWGNLDVLVSLDLSHNKLSGGLSSFDNTPFNSSLQELDLSYNAMTSLGPKPWQSVFTNLTFLDLSNNQFGGEISSLDALIQMNIDSLIELHVEDNNFTGTVSPFYFSALPNLTIATFDRNYIEGTLNLSTWFAALKEANADNSTAEVIPVTQKLFSFVNNRISNIVPSAKEMESTINSLRNSDQTPFSVNGILLGGNPFCQDAKSEAEQFLCRSTVTGPITDPHKSSNTVLIVSICAGVFALILSCVTLLFMWRLRKQVHALREIQQALADQQVQPPFYQFSELKTATKDFHKDNKLGHGGYGEVYKGVLPDETSFAVKKLFNSQQVQVLNEFLNEVVLITGIKHRNLVQLKGCCIKDKQRILVYEYVEKGNLAQALWGSKDYGRLNWNQRLAVCVGVARGLSYLHEELQPCILHRDIKPENILLDKNFQPKIADFGLARHFSMDSSQALYTKVAGTLGYFAPEYATQGHLSDKADVYSYGIVVLETISGRKCIDYSMPLETIFLKDWVQKMQQKGMLLDTLEPELRDNCVEHEVIRAINIGLQCVQNDPENRPTMSQVVTMFLGNMDVQVPSEESNNNSLLKELLVKVDHPLPNPSLPAVAEEEFMELPLMNFSFESSTSGSSSRGASKSLIQMSSIPGRSIYRQA